MKNISELTRFFEQSDYLAPSGAVRHIILSEQGFNCTREEEQAHFIQLSLIHIYATHSPMFTQMEGLVVDKGITLCDLQGMLDQFVQKLFGADTKTRLRPSYFPFTEPSVEVDVSCFSCGGKGCRLCKGTGWIEKMCIRDRGDT